MEKITINGKTYKYGGWAVCAYEFMLLCNEIEPEFKIKTESKTELIKIFKKSKELRGQDFLNIAIKKMATYLSNYDIYKNGYIPEITADYMEEFANSDSMQVDIEILINIIQAIKKIFLNLKIESAEFAEFAEFAESVESVESVEFSDITNLNKFNIDLIEKLHIYLINIIKHFIYY
jgi:hypothetical protein